MILLSSLATRFGDESVVRNTEAALEKIRAVLKSRQKESASQLRDRIRVIIPGKERKPLDYLQDIQKAISNNIILYLEYTDIKNQKTTREVEPIGIIYYTDQWHLIAWCWLRSGYRDFVVPQIDVMSYTSKPFKKNDHYSIDDHIKTWNIKEIGPA